MNRFPLFSFPLLRFVFISLGGGGSLFIIKLTITQFHDEVNHFLVGTNSRPVAGLVQFTGKFFISVVGSKIENKFVIIFSFCFIGVGGLLCFTFIVCRLG